MEKCGFLKLLQFNIVECCTHAVAQCLCLKNEFICFQNTPSLWSHLHLPKIPNRYSKLLSSLLLTSYKNLACLVLFLFLFPFLSFLSSQSFWYPQIILANLMSSLNHSYKWSLNFLALLCENNIPLLMLKPYFSIQPKVTVTHNAHSQIFLTLFLLITSP